MALRKLWKEGNALTYIKAGEADTIIKMHRLNREYDLALKKSYIAACMLLLLAAVLLGMVVAFPRMDLVLRMLFVVLLIVELLLLIWYLDLNIEQGKINARMDCLGDKVSVNSSGNRTDTLGIDIDAKIRKISDEKRKVSA